MARTEQQAASPGQPAVVLVVDTSRESRQVWQTALERRGYSAIVARSVQEARPLVERYLPRVVLVDDHRSIPPEVLEAGLDEVASDATEQDVLWLGKVSCDGRWLWQTWEKPYHYAAVLRRIEILCETVLPEGGQD